MAHAARASRSTSTVQRVRRWAFIVLTVDFVVLVALGVWLAFEYEPGGSSVSTAHQLLGLLAVAAALTAAIATVADDERSTAGVLPSIVVLAVVSGLYLTGPTLAWDGLVVTGDPGEAKGVTVVFDDEVGAVQRGNGQMTAEEYRRVAWLHVLALPLAVVIMGGAGAWALRRRRRYVPQRAASGS